ncbi:MAG: hypothetical protein ACI4B5_07330 [Bacteroidaceae bacterium]
MESKQYTYICIEGNAIDMMYNDQYASNRISLGSLMESPTHLKPLHEQQAPCDHQEVYEDLLRYTLQCVRTHNMEHRQTIHVVGLSYEDLPLISYDSRVWHVAEYNQLGLTDSLMTYMADEESDIHQLARLTEKKITANRQELERKIGKPDTFIWHRFFAEDPSGNNDLSTELLHKKQYENLLLFNQNFKGKKLIVGCPRLEEMIKADEERQCSQILTETDSVCDGDIIVLHRNIRQNVMKKIRLTAVIWACPSSLAETIL